MFGLSWTQILLIVVIGVFVLGPERIPVAVQWLSSSLRKARTMAQGAQEQLNSELGPELAEMRRQIAELQSLKGMQELKDLRDLHPKNLLGKGLLGDGAGTAGGVAGFLGLDKDLLTAPKPQSPNGPAEAVAAQQEKQAAEGSPDLAKPDPLPDLSKPDPLPELSEPEPEPELSKSAPSEPSNSGPEPELSNSAPPELSKTPSPLPAVRVEAPVEATVPHRDPLPIPDPLPLVEPPLVESSPDEPPLDESAVAPAQHVDSELAETDSAVRTSPAGDQHTVHPVPFDDDST